MRSKFLGNTNGELGSDMGAPVPFDFGRPAPSWAVNLALKSRAPYWINCAIGVVNSSPSCKCTGIATSRPICELVFWVPVTIATRNGLRKTNHRQVRRTVLRIRSSLLLRSIGELFFVGVYDNPAGGRSNPARPGAVKIDFQK